MNSVNKTLYIPLYGKAYVSKKGLFLDDKKAEQIWAEEGFTLKENPNPNGLPTIWVFVRRYLTSGPRRKYTRIKTPSSCISVVEWISEHCE